MLSRIEIAQVDRACRAIANEICDDNGFVSIRQLLRRFHASLLLRPLLVEGMIATIDEGSNDTAASRWIVLIDSETYSVTESDVEAEEWKRPLPSRFRNTVAHELTHSLAFRPSEFGIRLRSGPANKEDRANLVQAIERETERLSPLLLWPDKALDRFLHGRTEQLSVADLAEVRGDMGFSRHVLINRLADLRTIQSEFLQSHALQNLAIGLGEWTQDGGVLRSWPLFINFDRNLVPGFLRALRQQDRMPGREVCADPKFTLFGGTHGMASFEVRAGTDSAPNTVKLMVEMQVEARSTTKAREFLFVVRAPRVHRA